MRTIDCIRKDFSFIEDWDERYRYIIDLGEELDAFPDTLRTENNKIKGCTSQVWITTHRESGIDPLLIFHGTSDSHIVKGLITIIFSIFSYHLPSDILSIDSDAILSELGLNEHLTPQRSNGLHLMIKYIKDTAKALAP